MRSKSYITPRPSQLIKSTSATNIPKFVGCYSSTPSQNSSAAATPLRYFSQIVFGFEFFSLQLLYSGAPYIFRAKTFETPVACWCIFCFSLFLPSVVNCRSEIVKGKFLHDLQRIRKNWNLKCLKICCEFQDEHFL